MILALLFAVLLSISCLVGEKYGLGQHLWNLEPNNLSKLPDDIARVTKVLFAAYLSYSTAITFTKLSIITTYLRIFPRGLYLRRIIYAVTAVVIGFWISSIFAIIFTCVPVQAAWDYSITNAKCFGVLHYFYVAAGFNIGTDLLLCISPIPTLWALSMPRSQRLVLCMLFGMGFLYVLEILIIRLMLTMKLVHVLPAHFDSRSYIILLVLMYPVSVRIVPHKVSQTMSWHPITDQSVGSLNWSVVEVGTAIICASLSSLKPLASRCLPSFFPHLFSDASNPPQYFSSNTLAFEMVSSSDPKGLGPIYVQRTFDIQESPHSPSYPKSARIRPAGIDGQRAEFYEQTSQEDLVERGLEWTKANSKTPCEFLRRKYVTR